MVLDVGDLPRTTNVPQHLRLHPDDAVGLAGAVSMLVITLYVGNWFEKGRGTITGIALSGSGIGSAIASPIGAGIILAASAGALLFYLHWRVTTRPWEKQRRN